MEREERPENIRRMLAGITSVEIMGEENPVRVCRVMFPSVFGGREERVAINADELEAAGIEAVEGSHFFAWGRIDATTADEVEPTDFEYVAPLTGEDMRRLEGTSL